MSHHREIKTSLYCVDGRHYSGNFTVYGFGFCQSY